MSRPQPTATVAGVVAADSIVERLVRAVERDRGIRFVGRSNVGDEESVFVPWRELHADARAVAAGLAARGVSPGDHVAILGPTSRALITAIQGCWLAGAASMVLPLPMRMGSIEVFVESTRARIIHGDAALLLIDDALADFYEPVAGDPPTVRLAEVASGAPGAPGADDYERPDDDPERLVILQYTSGSTSEPKGVMIPDRVLRANIDALSEAAGLREDEVVVSWLPLYHDMGLVGLLGTAMVSGADIVQAAPQDFLAHPGNWMEWISRWGGTATAGPNFSWVLATRALGRAAPELDLSTLSLALSGAEPVDPDAVEAFVAAAGRFGFDPAGVFPAFGMAELAIAGTFPARGQGLVCDTVDRVVLERDRVAKPIDVIDRDEYGVSARRLALLGRPVPGLEMRIVEPGTSELLPERHVGELVIRGTSVTPGYYHRPEATAELFRDGWLCTGDLAYLLDEQLVLCGRIKDVIIVGGRNVFPEDIERAVGVIDGVRAGNVIAFGMEGYKGKESVVVVAETKQSSDDEAALDVIRHAIHHRTLEVCGIPPRDVILVRASTLPKTSSGKLQRSRCRELYLAEELELV